MKRQSLDLAFLRILLIAVPFGCGAKTFTESAPSGQCDSARTVLLSEISLRDGGATSDGGVRSTADGGVSVANSLTDADCTSICGDTSTCQPVVSDGGAVTSVACIYKCYAFGCGRRPESLPPSASASASALVRYLEEAAYLEAASVFAFRRLAKELAAHGAAADLVAWAERAAVEEVRHARVMARLVRRYGGHVTSPQPGSQEVRSLLSIACENAQEGCVRETYGALVAWIQSVSATEPHVRRVLQAIAAEETEHAKLAFAVAEFCQQRLSASEQAEVAAAQRSAVRELSLELVDSPPKELQVRLGLPSKELAARLVAQAQIELWPTAA